MDAGVMRYNLPNRIAEVVLFRYLADGAYRLWVQSLGLQSDERVLEIGCGGGPLARHLAAALPQGRLTCLEIEGGWLEVARRRLQRWAPLVTLVEGDARYWRGGEFDVVVVHFMLHDVPASGRDAVVATILSALAEGGRLCMREPVTHGVSEHELLGALQRGGLTAERLTHERLPLLGETVSGVWRRG